MILIIIYLFLLLVIFSGLLLFSFSLDSLFPQLQGFELVFRCILIGGVGGVLYCLRGIYLNYSVKDQWDDRWTPWYYIRPIVSLVMGGVSLIFLKAGLILLDANIEQGATEFGFFAIAFIAGLNVDNFIKKIEEIAQSSFGIGKSNASEE